MTTARVWTDEELRAFYVDHRLSFARIAQQTGLPWPEVITRILPGVRAPERVENAPTCVTCARRVCAVRHLLSDTFHQRPKQRAVPVPDFCLWCARPRAEVRIELAKAMARFGSEHGAAQAPARRSSPGVAMSRRLASA